MTAPMIRTTQLQVLMSLVSGSSTFPFVKLLVIWFVLVMPLKPSITLNAPTMMIMIPAKVFQPAPELL